MSGLKFTQSLGFFLKHSYRDTKRRKCHFCLALCSVFIVVLFSLVINTIVARGPIIFLKMAEANNGEIDGVVTPSQTVALGLDEDQSGVKFLNYTRYSELYQNQYNLAPRKTICQINLGSDLTNPVAQSATWQMNLDDKTGLPTKEMITSAKITTDKKVCLLLQDTLIERKIGIGRSYKYDPLKLGECIVSDKQTDNLAAKEGSLLYMKFAAPNLINAVINRFNNITGSKLRAMNTKE